VFRTRLPVASIRIATDLLPLDLHVLSLPLAFILSQDQTLHCKCCLMLTVTSKLFAVQDHEFQINGQIECYSLDLPFLFIPIGNRDKVLLFPNFQRTFGFYRRPNFLHRLRGGFFRECKGKGL
jgi:hypothetical protein